MLYVKIWGLEILEIKTFSSVGSIIAILKLQGIDGGISQDVEHTV